LKEKPSARRLNPAAPNRTIPPTPILISARFLALFGAFQRFTLLATQPIHYESHVNKMHPQRFFWTLDSFCPTSPATLEPKNQNYEPADLPFYPWKCSPDQPQLS
jgi:hypothetical protein